MRTHIESKWHNGDRAFLRADVDSLVGQMTMEEKILMLAGADWWHTLPVHRLNIPSVKRRAWLYQRVIKTIRELGTDRQCETALAATFSPSHVQRLANVLARETKDRGAVALLAPTVNIIRHPQGGRSFENFSEDTFLSGAIATAYIRGLQEEGVAAVVKHFVCNDQEHERSAVNVQVGERALREVYLKPFQMVVEDAKPLSIMSSYNKVNGEHVAESRRLLTDIVRNEWGFDGMIMSDWFGTYSVEEGIIAGQDLEMPGPAKFRTLTLLNHALATRRIQVKHINDAVSRILTFAQRVARLSPETVWGEDKEVTVVREDDRLTMREVGAKSHVLLKNDGAVLPLTGDKVHKIAVIGSRATATTVFGGGSAQLNTDYVVTVLEGMQRNAPDGVGVEYALGCVGHRYLPYLECTREDGQKGCDMRLYAKAENMNSPTSAVKQLHLHNSSALISDAVPPSLAGRDWFGLLEGEWVSPHEGEYEFGVIVAGRAKLFLNDTLIVDNWSVPQHRGDAFFGQGTTEVRGSFTVSKGERYWVKCEYSNVAGPPAEDCSGDDAQPIHNFAVRVGGHPKMSDEETIAAAVKLAREADAVVLAVGLGPDFETEGADRAHLRLPLATDRLIEAVAAVNPRTVVAVQSGSICLMPWADKVPAIVQAWYGGCESGASLASVIYGHVNPSGRLPLTIPKREEDIPAFLSFKSQKGIVRYNDDVHVGWKAYLDRHIEPSFAFGHGLSYTTFAYDDLSVKATSEFDLEFSVVVKNTGDIPGSHSALLYLSPPAPTADSWIHPSRRLAGFQFIEDLGPGQQRTARIRISRRELAHWDEVLDAWTVERGVWSAFLTTGSALDDVAVRVEFTIRSEVVWRGH